MLTTFTTHDNSPGSYWFPPAIRKRPAPPPASSLTPGVSDNTGRPSPGGLADTARPAVERLQSEFALVASQISVDEVNFCSRERL
jgi:hypothetical protein